MSPVLLSLAAGPLCAIPERFTSVHPVSAPPTTVGGARARGARHKFVPPIIGEQARQGRESVVQEGQGEGSGVRKKLLDGV